MLELYLGYVGLVVIHELGHYALLKAYKVKVVEVTIGNFLYMRLGIFKISPLIASGKITFSVADFNKQKIIPKLCILAVGPISNIVMSVLLSTLSTLLSSIALFMAMITLMPVPFLNTDGCGIVDELLKYFLQRKNKKGLKD